MSQKLTHLLATILLIFSTQLTAQDITATPGTYDLVAGSRMQFDGRPVEGKPVPDSYQWVILSGKGGNLLEADQSRGTFIAPDIDESSRNFTLQLTMNYRNQKSSSAQIRIRVHRKAQSKRRDNRSPWLHGAVGFGFGYLWGGWWDYPPIIVIPCPLPGIDILPEDLEPIAVPMEEDPSYDDWIASNPGSADFYDSDMALSEDLIETDMAVDTMEVEATESSLEVDSLDVDSDVVIEPAPMDRGGFDDGGYDRGGFDDGGFDDGGFDDGAFDSGGFDDF